jgi:hypothetical protein
MNALPGNNSVNTVERTKIEEAVFSVGPTDAPVDGLDSSHVLRVCCRPISVPRLYKVSKFVEGSYEVVVSYRSVSRRTFSFQVPE